MKIIKVMPKMTVFNLNNKEKLEGKYILQTQYKYRLAPHHPEHKAWFSVWTENHFDNINDSGIIYNVEVHIQFDNDEKKPTVKQLLELAKVANAKMNELLDELLIKASVVTTTQIGPVNDDDDTREVLQECIHSAYPEN